MTLRQTVSFRGRRARTHAPVRTVRTRWGVHYADDAEVTMGYLFEGEWGYSRPSEGDDL